MNMILRKDLINELIMRYNLQEYLEIGICVPEHNFDLIQAKFKVGVDPAPKGKCTYITTSDEYFKNMVGNQKFDIIFVDGLHTAEQSYRDVINGMKCLNDGGFIMMHDCNPPTKFHVRNLSEYEKTGGEWNGDVYKAFIQLKHEFPEWSCFVVNEDWGCGVLTKRPILENLQPNYITPDLPWEEFNERRNDMLQLITYDEFKQFIQQ